MWENVADDEGEWKSVDRREFEREKEKESDRTSNRGNTQGYGSIPFRMSRQIRPSLSVANQDQHPE